MSNCTVTIFGRPLSGLAPNNADYARCHLAELDDCVDCCAYRVRKAEINLEFAQRALARAQDIADGLPADDPW